jgi:hypothetical protein
MSGDILIAGLFDVNLFAGEQRHWLIEFLTRLDVPAVISGGKIGEIAQSLSMSERTNAAEARTANHDINFMFADIAQEPMP